MTRAASLLVALCLFAAAPAAQDGPDIDVSVDRSAEVGEAVTVRVLVTGAEGADCALLDLPEVDGARLDLLANPTAVQRKSVVNGRVKVSFTTEWKLQLVPERTGRIDIPALRFSCRGREVFSDPTYIVVSESSLSSDTVRLEISTDVRQVWVGQVFDVAIEAGVLREQWQNVIGRDLSLTLPWFEDGDHVMLLGLSPLRRSPSTISLGGKGLDMENSQELRDGHVYHLLSRGMTLLASAEGTLDLRDSRFSAHIATEVEQVRDPFSLFGRTERRATRSSVLDAYASTPPIEILPLPAEDRPPSFTNAVGDYRFYVNAEPRELAVGETCRLTIEVRGSGNLRFVEWPAFPSLDDDFRVFDKQEEEHTTYRRLVWDVAPLNDRVERIPSLTFSYFDPDAGEYRVLESPPIDLDVRPGGDGGLTDLDPSQTILHDLETIRSELPRPEPDPWPSWWLWAPAALALLVTEVTTRRRAWRERNPRAVARRAARSRLADELDAADDAGAAAGAFSRYLAARYDGPPAGMSATDAAAVVRSADPGLADELVATVRRWEAGYLGGASIDAEQVVDEARALADRLEALR